MHLYESKLESNETKSERTRTKLQQPKLGGRIREVGIAGEEGKGNEEIK